MNALLRFSSPECGCTKSCKSCEPATLTIGPNDPISENHIYFAGTSYNELELHFVPAVRVPVYALCMRVATFPIHFLKR